MKKMTSKLVKSLLGFAYRINPVFRYSLRQGLTVFVFHEVSDNPSEFARKYGLNLTIQNFRNQAEWINNNFNLVSPEALTANSTLPKNAALVTFDDGFELAFKNAFPILEELNIPVLMFMIAIHCIFRLYYQLISYLLLGLSNYTHKHSITSLMINKTTIQYQYQIKKEQILDHHLTYHHYYYIIESYTSVCH